MNIFELAVVVSAVDRATAVFNTVKNSISGATAAAEKMKNWGERASVSGALMKGASEQIVSHLESIVEPANAVEDSLAKVQSVLTPMSGTMTEALTSMRGAAIDWSNTHSDTATKFLDTTYMMISAGLNQTQSIEATRTAMLVAKATMGESTEAANLIGGVYNTMGDKTKNAAQELGRLGDVVTKTQQLFQFANFNQLSEGLKNSTAAALNTGLSFEQLNTVIGTLNSNQLQGAEAGTSLKAALLNMSKASLALKFDIKKTSDGGLDFIGTLKNIEGKFGNLRDMSPKLQEAFRTAFGDEGYAAISLLMGKSNELSDSLQKVKDSAGAAATAAAIMGGTGSQQTAALGNQMVGLKVILSDQLRPTLATLAVIASLVISKLSGFAQSHPTLVRTAGITAMVLAAITGIVGPILLSVGAIGMFAGHVVSGAALLAKFGAGLFSLIPAFGSAIASAWSFTAALLANPITWIVLGIVAAAALIYVYWDPIRNFFVGLWASIESAFVGAWNRVTAFLASVWLTITSAFDGGIMGVLGLFAKFTPLGLMIQALDAVTQWLFGFSLIDAGANILRTLTAGIVSAASGPINAVQAVVQKVRNLLPFSPAKEGPLRDLHRVRLVETIADTVRAAPLVAAMSGAAAAALTVMPAMAAAAPVTQAVSRVPANASSGTVTQAGSQVPEVAAVSAAARQIAPIAQATPTYTITMAPRVEPLPPPGARRPDGSSPGNGGDQPPAMTVQFNISGNADASTVASLEKWARDNSKLLYGIVKRQSELDKRSDFT